MSSDPRAIELLAQAREVLDGFLTDWDAHDGGCSCVGCEQAKKVLADIDEFLLEQEEGEDE